MNMLKSMVLTVAALTSSAVLAHDGSERASPAAEKMKIAQEMRFLDQGNNDTSRLASADEKSRAPKG